MACAIATEKIEMLLTIGMPVYNSSDSIIESLDSVLAQDWPGEFEILIVDDGSTDDTVKVIEDYLDDHRIRLVCHERNLGRPFARNTILKEARGEYLTWIDADDTWMPSKLRLHFDSFLKYSSDGDRAISICPFEVRWEGRGRPKYRNIPIDHSDISSILDASIQAYLWTMVCRTDLYRGVGGFDERLSRLQDTDIILRMLKSGAFFIPVDSKTALCTYNKTDSGKTSAEVFGSMNHIFSKHQVLFRRFGPVFFHDCRAMHHDLGRRHAQANGEVLREWIHRFKRSFHLNSSLLHRISLGSMKSVQQSLKKSFF